MTLFPWKLAVLTVRAASILVIAVSIGYMALTWHKPAQTSFSARPPAKAAGPVFLDIAAVQDDGPGQIKGRDIFNSVDPQQELPQEAAPARGTLPSNLKVVALMSGPVVQVVIEDTKAKQTYFITKDKPLAGIAIKQAEPGKLVITYDGQNIALPLKNNAPTP